MTDPRRFYLTTAIAYANNKPGLHTLCAALLPVCTEA